MNEFDSASELELPAHEPREARPWLISFADLMCLLLSVFVLLANASHIQADKAKHAIKSLGSPFAFGTAVEMSHVAPEPAGEALVGPKAMRDRLATRLHNAVPDLKMEEMPPGTVLRLSLPVTEVFSGNEVAPAFVPVLAAIAEEIQHGVAGIRFDIETVAAGSADEPAIARASALARELVVRGAPKLGVAAGIEKAAADTVVITVRAHPDDESRIDFHRLAAAP